MNRLIIIGAGGHGKVIADIALKKGYEDIAFVDDRVSGICMGFPIVGTSAILKELDDGKTDFVLGIGNNAVRKKIAESNHLCWATLIHPSAQVGLHVSVGEGTVVMAGAVINVCTSVGKHCIINTGATVDHDNVIEDFVHISVGSHLAGTVQVGENTMVGGGAVVSNNIQVCNDCMIGAGAVVVHNIETAGTYVGVPARKIR